MADAPEHQDITDAITDGPQAEAMAPVDGAATTGVPIVEPEMNTGDDRTTATPPLADADDDDTDEVLTEDLSVQGGE